MCWHWIKQSTNIILINPPSNFEDSVDIFILLMRKPRSRKLTNFAQGHITSKRWSWVWRFEPGSFRHSREILCNSCTAQLSFLKISLKLCREKGLFLELEGKCLFFQ